MSLRVRLLTSLGLWAALAACDLCPEPTYAERATDEAYLALLEAAKGGATADDAFAAQLTSPASGSQASLKDAPPVLEWSSGLVAQGAPGTAPRPTRWRLLDALLPTAHAHGVAMNGPGHLVRLKGRGLVCPLAHFTSRTTWAIAPYQWARLAEQAGQTLTVELLSASFSSNRVVDGPYKPSATPTLVLIP